MGLPFPGDAFNAFASGFLSIAEAMLVPGFLVGILAIVVICIIDVTRTRQAMRNYPVVDRSLPLDDLYPDQALG